MVQTMKRYAIRGAALVLALAAAACGNLSKVDAQGQSASLVWPDPKDATVLTMPGGTYPDPRQLAMVQAGMTKDQLHHLLGRPHFLEGFAWVREWDYLFHLKTASGEQACQYKVLFDRDMTARSFHWRSPACATLVQAGADKQGS